MIFASDPRTHPHGTVHCCAGEPGEPNSRVLHGNISWVMEVAQRCQQTAPRRTSSPEPAPHSEAAVR